MQLKNNPVKKHAATSIELNGKLYDAHSGKLLQDHKSVKKIDGISLGHKNAVKPVVHSRPERSHTLMRHAVKKPSPKPYLSRPNTAMDIIGTQLLTSPSLTLPNEGEAVRSRRAKSITRSSLVSRFGNLDRTGATVFDVKKSIISLPVVPAPIPHPKVEIKKTSPTEHLISKAMREAPNHHAKPAAHKKSRLHHKVAKKLGVSARIASLGLSGVAVLVLGSFIAYQNIPNFAVRYASAKAGLNARLPGYRPAGFAVNDKVIYSPGQITVNFKANADDRAFNITQKTSNWSSEALVANYVDKVTDGGPKAQPYSDSGRTIYLYGDSNATWVSEGVWYEISGNSNLTTDQLIKIATSI